MAGDVTLFHIWPSLCSQKVRLALAEKGVAYEGRIVNIGPPMENYEPWYVRMNPAAVVPTLKHGERIVTDSLEIVRYVDRAFEGPSLMPDDERRQVADELMTRIDRLQIRTLSYAVKREAVSRLIHGVVGLRARRLRRLKAENPDLAAAYDAKLRDVADWQRDLLDPAAVEAARAEVIATLGALDAALSRHGGPFVLGERYTLLDVMATALVARVKMLGQGHVLGPLPGLEAWYALVRARPSFEQAAMSEVVDKKKMAAVFLPWALPRVAALLLAIGLVVWLVSALR